MIPVLVCDRSMSRGCLMETASERNPGSLDGSNGHVHRELCARARATGARRAARERWETSPDSQSLVCEVHRGGYRVSRVERARRCAPRTEGCVRFAFRTSRVERNLESASRDISWLWIIPGSTRQC